MESKIISLVAFFLVGSAIKANPIQVGIDVEDFSFIEQAREQNSDDKRRASRLYEIAGIRTFPKAQMDNLQSWQGRLIVSHQQNYPTAHNSGFVQDLWLVAGKHHIVQIKAHTNREHIAFLYAGYGIRDVTWRGDEIVRTRPLPWKNDEKYNDYLSKEYDERLHLISDVLESFELDDNGIDRVIELVICAPTSHDGSPLVPVHIGLAFLNYAEPFVDMLSVSSMKVFYFDDVGVLSALHKGGAPWRVIEGKKNSPLKKIKNHLVAASIDAMTGVPGSGRTTTALATGKGWGRALRSLVGLPSIIGISTSAMFGISDANAPRPAGFDLETPSPYPAHPGFVPLNDFSSLVEVTLNNGNSRFEMRGFQGRKPWE